MKLSKILLEFKPKFKVKGIGLTYTDYGSFYGAYLHPIAQTANLPFGLDREKLHYEEAYKYIKDLTGLHLPDSYYPGQLQKIVDALKEKGIYADYDDAMDVS